MKIRERKGRDARLVLLRMVADSAVCGPIAAKWPKEGLFASRAENLIGNWAVKHYRKHGKAPRKDIGVYFDRWAEKQTDDEIEDFVGRFLESLSKELKEKKKTSSALVLDVATDVFDKARIENTYNEATAAMESGDMKRARSLMSSFRPVEVGSTAGVDLFAGGAVAREALRTMGNSLIKWPQEAQRLFFANTFARQEFITFVGPEKSGKSFHLSEVAILAAMSECNVAFFEVGDQSQHQILRRFMARAAGRPFKADDLVRIPIELTPGEEGPNIEYQQKKYKEPMTPKEGSLALKEFRKKYGERRFMLSVHPNSSINVLGIEEVLNQWKMMDEWIPDMVVIDYPDILAPMPGMMEGRDSINASWKAMRGISQKWDACVVVATQSDTDSYSSLSLDKGNFSEDKRKNAHVTGAIGINQTTVEKDRQLSRLNWILARDLEFSTEKHLYCAQCLALANPMVLTCFK